jgi:hypothetical protein
MVPKFSLPSWSLPFFFLILFTVERLCLRIKGNKILSDSTPFLN